MEKFSGVTFSTVIKPGSAEGKTPTHDVTTPSVEVGRQLRANQYGGRHGVLIAGLFFYKQNVDKIENRN